MIAVIRCIVFMQLYRCDLKVHCFPRVAIKTKSNCFNVVMSLVSPLECLGVVFDPVIHSDDNLGDKGVVIYCYAVARDKMKRFVSL